MNCLSSGAINLSPQTRHPQRRYWGCKRAAPAFSAVAEPEFSAAAAPDFSAFVSPEFSTFVAPAPDFSAVAAHDFSAVAAQEFSACIVVFVDAVRDNNVSSAVCDDDIACSSTSRFVPQFTQNLCRSEVNL